MKELHARALILLNVGEKANAPEIKAKATAVAQMWLTIAALEDALTHWRDQVEMERAQAQLRGPFRLSASSIATGK